jgi:hypothetical protein
VVASSVAADPVEAEMSEAWTDELPVAAPDIPAVDDGAREVKPSVGVPAAPGVLSLVGIPDCWLAVAVDTKDEPVASERLPVGVAVACPPVSVSVEDVFGFKSVKSVISRDVVGVDKAPTTGEVVGASVGTSSESVPEVLVNEIIVARSGLSVGKSVRTRVGRPEVSGTRISVGIETLNDGRILVGRLTVDRLGSIPVGRTSVGRIPVDRRSVGRIPVDRRSVGRIPVEGTSVGRRLVGSRSVGKIPVDKTSVGRKLVGSDGRIEVGKRFDGRIEVGRRPDGRMPVGAAKLSEAGTSSMSVDTAPVGLGSESVPEAPGNDIPTEMLGRISVGRLGRRPVGRRPGVSDTGTFALLVEAGASVASDSTPVGAAPDNDMPEVGIGSSGSSVGRPETSDTGMTTLLIDGNRLSKKLGVREAGMVPLSVT